ncbi:MAG: tripartite tricarboxylate transporter substrate binding protein [Betaproteobacteria bacterium]|nr:tripartite tricarboxylate transporter substrate binding protein [Betaproteobacteria bacterium]
MMMFMRVGLLAACAAAVLTGPVAHAQGYPARPVRLIVPFAPGGPTDVVARIVGQHLTERLGQQVIVDNRGGAGGNIGMGLAARATPDGYTILLVSSSFVVNPSLYSSIPYDPYKDFIPISNLAASPNVFTVHPTTPVKSIAELIAQAKSNPGKLSIATPGIGTTPDLSARLIALTAKVDLAAVPFGGAGPAVAAVVGNQLAIGCTAMPPTTPHIKAGRLRAIAVTALKRSDALPDVPTLAEAGYAGQEAETLQGLLAPAGTPKAVVDRLSKEFTAVMRVPAVESRVTELGFYIIASSPQQFQAQIKTEIEKWGRVIRSANLKVD